MHTTRRVRHQSAWQAAQELKRSWTLRSPRREPPKRWDTTYYEWCQKDGGVVDHTSEER